MARRALLRAGCRPSVNARHIAERTRLLEGLALSTAFPGSAAGGKFPICMGFMAAAGAGLWFGICFADGIASGRAATAAWATCPVRTDRRVCKSVKPNGSRLGAVRLSDWRVSKNIKKNGSRLVNW